VEAANSVASSPYISVVIPTYNAPDDVRRCLDSLSQVVYPHWDVLLMDQSDDERSRAVAEGFGDRLPNLAYYRPPERSTCRARNTGMELSRGDIIALLDHDCTVPGDWLQRVADVFARLPETPLVFGAVEAVEKDRSRYFVPDVVIEEERTLRGCLAFLQLVGAGMCMFLRRELLDSVGLFDPYLGPGPSIFSAAEDEDYRYRCLACGYSVCNTPAIVVQHHALRAFASGAGQRTIREYAYSAAGCYMKLLRCGELPALVIIAVQGWRLLRSAYWRNIVRLRRPFNTLWITMFVRGLGGSFQFAVDRRRCLYRLRGME